MKVGDFVQWTHVSSKGKTISMSLREGEIESISGNYATIKKKGGRRETVALCRLRRPEQKSQIAEFVEAIVEAKSS